MTIILPEFPDLIPGELDLTTVDGNAFAIMAAVQRDVADRDEPRRRASWRRM
jgi:hypothetical protein